MAVVQQPVVNADSAFPKTAGRKFPTSAGAADALGEK
jgi:hypothetical protein